MKSFYYRVGGVETNTPWLLPNFDRVKLLTSLLKSDSELSDFKIFLHGDVLKSWVTWDVKLFLEFENWEMNLDMVFLERIMSKIYKYGFDNKVLLDVTFCGNHQNSDLYSDAESRDFDIPVFNNSDFIKFNSIVKSVDGISEEILISDKFLTTQLSDKLVKWDNIGTKYSSSLINKNDIYIFREGLLIDIFLSFDLNQFEEIKKGV